MKIEVYWSSDEDNIYIDEYKCPNCNSKNIKNTGKRIYPWEGYYCLDCRDLFEFKIIEE